MVQITTVYEGHLHCRLRHEPSGQEFTTDAPADHQGKGEAFSPTDLVGAALGSCILTVMGIVAQRRQLDLTGTTAQVTKEMADEPVRRIRCLAVTVTFPSAFTEDQRRLLEGAARSCPVHHSLHPDIDAPVTFVYPSR